MPDIYFETETGYRIHCPEQATLALGRRDEVNKNQIDIDFSQQGENGVSRLHAFIYVKDDRLFIEDFNSRNGTFLNHYQLIPLRTYTIKAQDKLKLGRIELTVHIDS